MSREEVVYGTVAGGGVDLRYSPELSGFPEKLPLVTAVLPKKGEVTCTYVNIKHHSSLS
jgi:hypothetical protein